MDIHVEESDVKIPARWLRFGPVITHEDGDATVTVSLHPVAGFLVVANAIARAFLRALTWKIANYFNPMEADEHSQSEESPEG